MTGALDVAADAVRSLYSEAGREAERHKWIESEKHGRDLGSPAIREWYRLHWHRYCRQKRLEHLAGRACWMEFERETFGRLAAQTARDDLLFDRVLDRVQDGWENLDVLNWALLWGLDSHRVVEILTVIDVNRARLEPREG
jgi:hypothetical protein